MKKTFNIIMASLVFASSLLFCSDKKSAALSEEILKVANEHADLIRAAGLDAQRYMQMPAEKIAQMITSDTSSSFIDVDALKKLQEFEEKNSIALIIKQFFQKKPEIMDQVNEENRKKELHARFQAKCAEVRARGRK